MFSLNERKTNTIQIIEYIKKMRILNISKNNGINGFILVLLHWILTGIPLLYLFFGEINNYYYLSIIIWFIIILMHFYFKGCILTRAERNIWNEKKWWGPWVFVFTPIELLGIKITHKIANIIFNLWGMFIISTIVYRMYY